MSSDKCIKKLSFDGKYISGEAKDVLIDTTETKYIIKGSTGIGGTTAILNYSDGNYIISSPNVGMIQAKEKNRGEYKSHRQFFIYGGSKDQWSHVKEYWDSSEIQNAIINTTPDQIVNARANYFNKMVEIPLFVDEAHLYVQDAEFRDSMGSFLEVVYHEWKANYTFSTATPLYNFWDIPQSVEMNYYNVSSTLQKSKKLDISYDKKAIKEFVYEQNELGRLVVVFTNNQYIHTQFRDLRGANLVGDKLRVKIAPYQRVTTIHDVDMSQIDVLMLSSKYYAGFDIDYNCSILIISDQSNPAWKINVNNIVQAYGRCRQTVHQALLVNLNQKKGCSSDLQVSYTNYQNKVKHFELFAQDNTLRYADEFQSYMVNHTYINRAKLMAELINDIDSYHLNNHENLVKALNEYGFEINEFNSLNKQLKKEIGVQFSERISNLLNLPFDGLKSDYNSIKYNLKYKSEGTFSPKLALEYLTALILKRTNSNQLMGKLRNKRIYPKEFYKYFSNFLLVNGVTKNHLNRPTKKFLQSNSHYLDEGCKTILQEEAYLTNQWFMLYRIYQISNNDFSGKILRNMTIEQAIYNEQLYMEHIKSSNRCKNVREGIFKILSSNNISPSNKELERIKRKVVENYQRLRAGKKFGIYYQSKYIKKVMTEAILHFLTNGKYGASKYVDYREYNPLTALPKSLRSIVPIKYIEIDLTAANAQFVDLILGTNISSEVYQNVMNHYDLTRNQAKWKYNSMLNNHYESRKKASAFYQNAGYSEDEAHQLANLTAETEKGAFFKLMTQYEQATTDLYNEILDLRGLRFHDALVVSDYTVSSNGWSLPTKIKTQHNPRVDFLTGIELPADKIIHFHMGYYNNPDMVYQGEVQHELYEFTPIN